MVAAERDTLRMRMQSMDCSVVARAAHDLAVRDDDLDPHELGRARGCVIELRGLEGAGLAHDYLRLLDEEFAPTEAARLARSADVAVRHEAFAALARMGESALPELATLGRDADAVIRSRAYGAIGRVGGRPAMRLLVDGLHDDDHGVRWTASAGLLAGREEAFVPVLQAIAYQPPTRPFHRAAARVVRRCWPAVVDDEALWLARVLEGGNSVYQAPPLAFDLLMQMRSGITAAELDDHGSVA